MIDQCEVDFDALLHGWIRKALGHALPVDLVGELLATLREVILTIGILDMREQLGPFALEMHTAPEPITRRTHLSGVHIGLGQHADAKQ